MGREREVGFHHSPCIHRLEEEEEEEEGGGRGRRRRKRKEEEEEENLFRHWGKRNGQPIQRLLFKSIGKKSATVLEITEFSSTPKLNFCNNIVSQGDGFITERSFTTNIFFSFFAVLCTNSLLCVVQQQYSHAHHLTFLSLSLSLSFCPSIPTQHPNLDVCFPPSFNLLLLLLLFLLLLLLTRSLRRKLIYSSSPRIRKWFFSSPLLPPLSTSEWHFLKNSVNSSKTGREKKHSGENRCF